MSIPRGLWDETGLADGWFDETQQPVGWWDADLLDVAAAGGVTASLAWTEDNDVAAVTVVATNEAALAWTEVNDTTAISVDVASVAVDAAVAWTEDNDGCQVIVLSAAGGFVGYGPMSFGVKPKGKKKTAKAVKKPDVVTLLAKPSATLEQAVREIAFEREAAQHKFTADLKQKLTAALHRAIEAEEEEAVVAVMVELLS